LVVVLALMHVVGWSRKEHGLPWSAAAAAASKAVAAGGTVGVAPRNGINVVRYYLREAEPPTIVEATDADPPPDVVIVTDGFDREKAAALARRYPRRLANLREVMVRGR
jgi:hypothetical protein